MVYAQHGEDELLASRFPQRHGVFVEVGAADGVQGSNSLFFEERGWSGVLVEPNPYFAARCRDQRINQVAEYAVTAPDAPRQQSFQVVRENPQLSGLELDAETIRVHGVQDVEVVSVACRTLDEVLREYLGDKLIDFVTIDVEGHEWSVIQGFSLDVWQPSVVIIERNFHPDLRIFAHMWGHGYAYTRTTGVNDWFERGRPQSRAALILSVAPLYRKGARRTVKRALDRLHLLDTAARLRRLGGR